MPLRASSSSSSPPKPAFSAVQKVVNFEETVAKRPDFDHSAKPIKVTKSPDPDWSFGDGVRTHQPRDETPTAHKEIDPYSPDRSVGQNYRLLVSGIAPRPVGLVSTVSPTGKKNLAPFSYFQLVDHDPPLFVVSFSSRHGADKDTLANLEATRECVINSVSESMIEAVSSTSIDAPYGVSEWGVSGLTEGETTTVKPSRVRESIFSIEGRVVDIKELAAAAAAAAATPQMSRAAICLVKATRFWVRQDAANSDFSHIDLDKLRPVGQLGGISYGRITSTFELPRTRWEDEQPKSELLTRLQDEAETTDS